MDRIKLYLKLNSTPKPIKNPFKHKFTMRNLNKYCCICGGSDKVKPVYKQDFQDVFCDKHYEEWKIEQGRRTQTDLFLALFLAAFLGAIIIGAKVLFHIAKYYGW
jgi:hypothetical protein